MARLLFSVENGRRPDHTCMVDHLKGNMSSQCSTFIGVIMTARGVSTLLAERSNLFDFHSYPRFPLEMHVVYFKAKYIYYEEAVKYNDGVIFEVHFFYIQNDDNPSLSPLTDKLSFVHKSGTSAAVDEYPLTRYFTPFTSDYFLYSGKIISANCKQNVMWIICRHLIGVSHSQLAGFRTLFGHDDLPLLRNFTHVYKIGKRKIYHVNGSDFLGEMLYPFPKIPPHKTERLCIRFCLRPSNKHTTTENNLKIKKKNYLNREKDYNLSKTDSINDTFSAKTVNYKKQYYEKNMKDREKSIFDPIIQWIRNSVAHCKRGSNNVLDSEMEKDHPLTIDINSVAFTKLSKIDTSSTSFVTHKEKTNSSTVFIKTENKEIQVNIVPNKEGRKNYLINRHNNPKLHIKNSSKLLSHLGSNFSLDVLKPQMDGIETKCVNEKVLFCYNSIHSLKPNMSGKEFFKHKCCNSSIYDDQIRIRHYESHSTRSTKSFISRLTNMDLKNKKHTNHNRYSKYSKTVKNNDKEQCKDFKTSETYTNKIKKELKNKINHDKHRLMKSNNKLDVPHKHKIRKKVEKSHISENLGSLIHSSSQKCGKKQGKYLYCNDTNVEHKIISNKIKKCLNDKANETKLLKTSENNFKISEIKGNNCKNVKVKNKRSHESIYIHITKGTNDSTEASTDTKTKIRVLIEWLLSAKEMITGLRKQ